MRLVTAFGSSGVNPGRKGRIHGVIIGCVVGLAGLIGILLSVRSRRR